MAAKLRITRRSKYRNVRFEADGYRWDSKREYARWLELKMLEKAGEICNLERQVTYDLLGAFGVRVAKYRSDFSYINEATGKLVIEDVKSPASKTPVYRLKKRLMAAMGLFITEV